MRARVKSQEQSLLSILDDIKLSVFSSGRGQAIPPLSGLEEFPFSGSNPGNLKAFVYVPEALLDGAPLVVVLHGCTQTAEAFCIGSGWAEMADRCGFMLLFPEQQRQNNPNLCFNWFSSEDNQREKGEACSIHQMVEATTNTYRTARDRIFITGLSAGGAMTSAMLAAYPDVFAGGAIIAGLPYGCASSIPQAFAVMRGQGLPSDAELADIVRDASNHRGAWPIISVWQGGADTVVSPVNANAILSQWKPLHGIDSEPNHIEVVNGAPRREWRNKDGLVVIEEFRLSGMGHGVPLASTSKTGIGKPGPYMLEVGISSTRHICQFFGLFQGEVELPRDVELKSRTSKSETIRVIGAKSNPSPEQLQLSPKTSQAGVASHIKKTIEDALRGAGLMR